MSELKAIKGKVIYDEIEYYVKGFEPKEVDDTVGSLLNTEYYLKSEVDKVISELKAQKAQAEDDCAYWKMSEGNAANAMHEKEEYAMQLYKEVRHSNYKRCVDKVEICCEKKENCYNRALRKYNKDEADYLARKSDFWTNWEFRWLKLAEKFKEAK